MKCPNCKEIKLRVNRTVNLDGTPMTIRYYICPRCKTTFGSTEKLDKRYLSDETSILERIKQVNA